ncbi:MAG: hypothetical protein PHI88_00445 [Candidatus Pacebacteria bacterium]|nr:hypothetical protein [Candidatus Paceibacterota bacterium]
MKDSYELSKVADVLCRLGYRDKEEWEKIVSQLISKISMVGFKEVEFLPKDSSFIIETGNLYFCLVAETDKLRDEITNQKYKVHFVFAMCKDDGELPCCLSESEAERLEVKLSLPQYDYQEVIGYL